MLQLSVTVSSPQHEEHFVKVTVEHFSPSQCVFIDNTHIFEYFFFICCKVTEKNFYWLLDKVFIDILALTTSTRKRLYLHKRFFDIVRFNKRNPLLIHIL